MIDFACDQCGKRFQVGDHLAGKSGQCKKCGAPIQVPAKATATALAGTDEDQAIPDLSGVRPNQMVDLLSDADPMGALEALNGQFAEIEASGPAIVSRGYTYKMVQIPPNIQVMQGTSTQGRAAVYLEDVVNEHAAEGWDFYRVDPIGIQVNPGCLMALLGVRSHVVNYYVITFRRPVGT